MLTDWATLCGLVASIEDWLTRVAPAEREMFAEHLGAYATGIAKQFPEGR